MLADTHRLSRETRNRIGVGASSATGSRNPVRRCIKHGASSCVTTSGVVRGSNDSVLCTDQSSARRRDGADEERGWEGLAKSYNRPRNSLSGVHINSGSATRDFASELSRNC